MNASANCPTCGSPAPERHPAVQHEGEVQPCRDPYHLTVTPQNTPERIAEAQAILDRGAVLASNVHAALAACKAAYPGSRWNDAEHDPVSDLEELRKEEREKGYERGFLDGLAAYAYSTSEQWAESGVQYVGRSGTTLKQAKEQVRETWNYAP